MSAYHDRIGRRNRLKPISTDKRISPQTRDLLWFEKIAEHGPLPSSFLLEYGKQTHKSVKRAKERLTDLFNEENTPDNGTYLTRPLQQFRTIDSRYNQLVYDLSPASIAALRKSRCSLHPKRSGPWQHSLMVSCITASIELACSDRDDINYIPQSKILTRADASLRWATTICDLDSGATYCKDLLPDAVFGLEYILPAGKRYRFFALEADRSTEPLRSTEIHRKSFIRHLMQYEDYIEQGGYRDHLMLTAPMIVLNVVTSEARLARMLTLTQEYFPDGCNYQMFKYCENFGTVFQPPFPLLDLFSGVWTGYNSEANISKLR